MSRYTSSRWAPTQRSIPPVLDDPRAVALTLPQRHTLVLLPLAMDDHGRALDDAGSLNGLLWGPLWQQHTPEDLEADLAALAAAGFITRYEIAGVRYLQVLDWHRQQPVSRPAPSRYPAPPSEPGSAGRPVVDDVWAAIDQLVGMVSGAAEKLHDPATQARGVRLVADLAEQIDPKLGRTVRERGRAWTGGATFRTEPAEATVSYDQPPPTTAPDDAPGPDDEKPTPDAWKKASDDV